MNAGVTINDEGLIVDLFAGGGGASIGIEQAFGEDVDIAINHDADAIRVHKANHPRTKHFQSDIWEIDPVVATEGKPVKFLHASPDCKHFSRAKGDTPKSQHIRALADVVVTWARKTLPLVISMENVPEFPTWGPLGPDGRPIKNLAGEFYDQWKAEFVALGYIVDTKILIASEHGAPTSRKRWFMIARRDGRPITWPEPTHGDGPGLKPMHTAAECLDFDRQTTTVFSCVCEKPSGKKILCSVCGLRRKPLADKTLRRVAAGIERYVMKAKRPFIVKVNHGSKAGRSDARVSSIDEPLSTITGARRGHALVVPTLIQTGYGERKGQRPRYLDIHKPMGTLVGCAQRHALVATFLAKSFGDPNRSSGGGAVIGSTVDRPIGTITQRDHHSVVAASLVKYSGTSDSHPGAGAIDEPLPTIRAGGNHAALLETELSPVDRRFQSAYFIEYYGQGSGLTGAPVDAPIPTITTKARFALVTIDGVDYAITDIRMRMVDPDELAHCQFGRYVDRFDMSAVKTKAGQTKLVGNSVPPELEEALVAVNLPDVTDGWAFSARRLAAAA